MARYLVTYDIHAADDGEEDDRETELARTVVPSTIEDELQGVRVSESSYWVSSDLTEEELLADIQSWAPKVDISVGVFTLASWLINDRPIYDAIERVNGERG